MNSQTLAAQAERAGIPERTVDDVRAALHAAQRQNSDRALAALMLKHGRLTADARAFVSKWPHS